MNVGVVRHPKHSLIEVDGSIDLCINCPLYRTPECLYRRQTGRNPMPDDPLCFVGLSELGFKFVRVKGGGGDD